MDSDNQGKEIKIDVFLEWSNACLVQDSTAVLSKDDIYKSFCSWYNNNVDRQKFFTFLGRLDSSSFLKFSKKKRGKKSVCFEGARLLPKNVENVSVIMKTPCPYQQEENSIFGTETPLSSIKQNSFLTHETLEFEDSSKINKYGCTAEHKQSVIFSGQDEVCSVCSFNSSVSSEEVDGSVNNNKGIFENFDFNRSIDSEGNSGENISGNDNSSYSDSDEEDIVSDQKNEGNSIRQVKCDIQPKSNGKPLVMKVHPFFGKPEGALCVDQSFVSESAIIKKVPFRKENKESKYFNFSIFAKHYQNIKSMTYKNMPCDHDSLADFLRHTLPKPDNIDDIDRSDIWKNSGCSEKSESIKAFLCGSFCPVKVGNVAPFTVSYTYIGDIFPQFVLVCNEKITW